MRVQDKDLSKQGKSTTTAEATTLRTSTTKTNKIRAHKVLYGWLIAGATLIGGAVVFLPRPVVTQGDPVELRNPFSAPFTITNTGIIPLTHANVRLALCQIMAEPAKINPNLKCDWTDPKKYPTGIAKPEWKDHYLGMDDRYTITLGDMWVLPSDVTLNGAVIGIVVDYEPLWIPWRREKLYRFDTHKQSNGYLYWYSVPVK